MRLLGDVRLIGECIVHCWHERARANQASKFEVREYRDHYCYNSRKYNWKPSLLEHCGEVAVLLGETHFNAGSRSRVRSLDYAQL